MVWLIVVVAVAMLGLAAWAGTGKFGEMPPVVNDRPKGLIPDGPVDQAFLATVRFPTAASGYDGEQVMEYLALVAKGVPVAEPEFDVRAGGLDMQAVDDVLDRDGPSREQLADAYFSEAGPEAHSVDRDLVVEPTQTHARGSSSVGRAADPLENREAKLSHRDPSEPVDSPPLPQSPPDTE